jgi:hypothetical protein
MAGVPLRGRCSSAPVFFPGSPTKSGTRPTCATTRYRNGEVSRCARQWQTGEQTLHQSWQRVNLFCSGLYKRNARH